jgi:hypothetical protein
MASVYPSRRLRSDSIAMQRAGSLARRMSRHSSAALLVFSIIQVWAVVTATPVAGSQWLPLVALGLLVVIAIPFARRIERRWGELADNALPCPALLVEFRRDRARLWALALLVPALWVVSYAAVAEAATRAF